MVGNPISRRELARYAAALAVVGCGGTPSAAHAASPAGRSSRWYDDAIVIDGCGQIGRDLPTPRPDGTYTAIELAEAAQSGVTAFAVTVDDVTNDVHAYEHTRDAIADTFRDLALNASSLMLIRNGADLRAAKSTRRVGFIFAFQGTTALGPDLEHLDEFQKSGVRIVQLTYNIRNLLGDGCLEAGNAGLSTVGRKAVERLNAARVLIDLSHCGQRTTAEAIELSRRPVVITHTACAALVDRPRNKRDEEMRRCAAKGGVVGIYFMPFLRMSGQPMSDDVIAHIEHALDVCGEDHVSVGTDGTISPIELTPAYIEMHHKFVADRVKQGIAAPGESADIYNFCPDLNTPRRFETLGEKLLARHHSEAAVKKILGGNFARVFEEICG